MKRLIFIDNDRLEHSKDALDYIKDNLEYHASVPVDVLNTIETVADFHFVDKDEQYKMMYDENNIILTWSMFTSTHYNSLGKLNRFLMTAGMSDVKGHVYIDCASNLEKALTRIIENPDRYAHYFIRGLETNYIIGMNSKDTKFYRMRFDATIDSFIRREDIDINSLLS